MTDRRMTLTEHLGELRRRMMLSLAALLIATALAFLKTKDLIAYLMRLGRVDFLVFISPAEAFLVNLKLAFLIGLFVSSPILLFQIWRFVSAGLTEREQRRALFYLPFSVALFICGAAFAFFVVVPWALKFLINFGGDGVLPMLTVSKYVSFFLGLTLMFGAAFEFPIAVIILTSLGIVKPAALGRNRKYAIIIIFIAAAVMTPTPDAFTQLLMAIPLVFLYELSVLLSRAVNLKNKKE